MVSVTPQQQLGRWDNLPIILRELLQDPNKDDALYEIGERFQLDDWQINNLIHACDLVIYGFLAPQQLFDELKEVIKTENNITLQIYQTVDEKVFAPWKQDIEKNFVAFKLGAVQSQDIQKPRIDKEVNLKGTGTVNLKKEDMFERIDGSAMFDKLKSVPMQNQGPTEKKMGTMIMPDGPFIIHKKDEIPSATQTRPQEEYKQISYGGYKGSFNTSFTPRSTTASISKAQIQVAGDEATQTQEEKKIPLTVKEFGVQPKKEEKIKMVNYTTPKSPEIPKPSEPQGTVNLDDLTLKK